MLLLPLPYKRPCHCCCLIKSLAAASLPEYVATHSQPTGYLRPCELDTDQVSERVQTEQRQQHCGDLSFFTTFQKVSCNRSSSSPEGEQQSASAEKRNSSNPALNFLVPEVSCHFYWFASLRHKEQTSVISQRKGHAISPSPPLPQQ